MRHFFCTFALLSLALWACQRRQQDPSFPQVTAMAETDQVRRTVTDDAADDPAVWVHPTDSTRSLIIGTVKDFGIEVYNLQGRRLRSYAVGNPNNIDVAYGFALGNGKMVDLVGCSERERNELRFWRVDPASGQLYPILAAPLVSGVDEVYGFCFYRSVSNRAFYAFVNGKNGSIEQWQLAPAGDTLLTATRVRTLQVASQPEGMVADPQTRTLFVGEEDRGIWRFPAEPNQPNQGQLLPQSGADNSRIAFDVEGLTIYFGPGGSGFLLASSQGNNTYAVFDRQAPHRYRGSFAVGDGIHDGTAETDGIEACSRDLGEPYRQGILVVQDGFNTSPAGKALPQNFKLIPWSRVDQRIAKFK